MPSCEVKAKGGAGPIAGSRLLPRVSCACTSAGNTTSGANWAEWCHDKYTLEDIETALDRVEAGTTGSASRGGRGATGRGAPGNVVPLPAAGAARQHNPKVSQWHWVEMLLPAEIDAMLDTIASDPAMRDLADSERGIWLPVLFGFAACEAAGATGAQEAARAWSQTSPRYLNDADYDRDWNSFDPKRQDGITVGTLIHHAEAVGIDLEPWRERARARQNQNDDKQKGSAQQIRHGAPLSQLPHVIDAASAPSYLNPRFSRQSSGEKAQALVALTAMEQSID
jgi:hypothetical protein